MSASLNKFVTEIAARFPTLTEALKENTAPGGEILTHVFLADLTRHVTSLAVKSKDYPDAATELRAILDFLEERFEAAENLSELISVSFLENLPRPNEEGGSLRAMLGPYLTRQLNVIG